MSILEELLPFSFVKQDKFAGLFLGKVFGSCELPFKISQKSVTNRRIAKTHFRAS
jgi:hypothetical protein